MTLKEELTMVITGMLTRVLWLLRYPSFCPEPGPYRVGATRTRIPGSVACQIHYPAAANDVETKSKEPYFRPKAADGVAAYSKMSPNLFAFLSKRQHPCAFNAKPHADGPFPLVIFSHGLGGCMEMYTQLCQQVASKGYMVVAMEHEDGSGAYAETPTTGEYIAYKRPDDTPYSREKVLDFRKAFLERRVEETTQVIDYMMTPEEEQTMAGDNKAGKVSDLLLKLRSVTDQSKSVALLGHSFGGASMIMTAQKYLKEQQTPTSIVVGSLSVLDPWAFSLDDAVLDQGIPKEIPTLSILSEAWLTNPETAQVDQFLRNCPSTLTSLYTPNALHSSFSDAVSWLPGFILRRIYLRGKNEKRCHTIRKVGSVCSQHILLSLAPSSNTARDTHLDFQGLALYEKF